MSGLKLVPGNCISDDSRYQVKTYTIHTLTNASSMSKLEYMAKNLISCQQVVFELIVASCCQVWNKLLPSCNKVDEENKHVQSVNVINLLQLVSVLWQ